MIKRKETKSDMRSRKAFEITKNVKTSCEDILQEVNSGIEINFYMVRSLCVRDS